MNKIDKDGNIDHGKYKIACFVANNKRYYQPRVKIKMGWWYSKKFYQSTLEAGDKAREIVYG